MSDLYTTELIERLREPMFTSARNAFEQDTIAKCAADALESQAKRIAELEAECERLRVASGKWAEQVFMDKFGAYDKWFMSRETVSLAQISERDHLQSHCGWAIKVINDAAKEQS